MRPQRLVAHFEKQGIYSPANPPTLDANGMVLSAILLGEIANVIERYGAIRVRNVMVGGNGPDIDWAKLLCGEE